MKSKKIEAKRSGSQPGAPIARPSAAGKQAPGGLRWPLFAALAGAAILAFWVYGPSLHGPFLFDDNTLLFTLPTVTAPLAVWLNIRPVLMLSYLANIKISGSDTFSYHVLNVLIHCAATGLIFLSARRVLEWAKIDQRTRTPLAAFCALLFLLHPAQAEAVAYLSGRSEALSSMLFYGAFAVFIYRRESAITWKITAVVIALFLLALGSKEQAIALPALLLLTDYWWNPGFALQGIRENWRLYAAMAAGAVLGLIRFAPLIFSAQSAGFGMKDLPWYQYLFTQFRAIFVYIREFFLPFGLNPDWDFPFSRTIFDHGSIMGLIALVALIAAALYYRRKLPLASYGFLTFLLLLAPTSSVLPIRDPIAERRIYFAMFGLLLVAADIVRRIPVSRTVLSTACGALLLIAAVGTHARAELWSSELALWQDVATKSPDKPRMHFQLATAYFNTGDCARAAEEFTRTAKYTPDGYSRYNLLLDWGLALDCASQPELALSKFSEAAGLEKTAHVYSQIAKVYGERRQWNEALDALETAQKIDLSFAPTYAYRGIIYLQTNRCLDAVQEFQRALAFDPSLEPARQGLAQARQCAAAPPAAGAGH
jgi:tetratricopeptide (TPR) repeat protein